ncbi:MAG: AAA family ATPase, partial [Ktedonobacterales bacterium]|nr:AAA family ATPase [Ktedonobacterales bacterium]
MITLHRLTIRDFKSLRAVDLLFPPHASVLIEGFNESGKSSLFEAVIFALYGDLLVTEETGASGRGRAVSAIRYGAEVASVRLEFDVGDTHLTVERVLKKKGPTTATLAVRHGATYEPVQGQTEVSHRILAEMGNLTKDALLNSCFVEQKQLGKLEDMSTGERQAALEQLLNLAKLGKIQRQMEVTRDENGALAMAEERLRFATQARQLTNLAADITTAQRDARTLALAHMLAERATTQANLARWQADAAALTAERARYASADARLRALNEAQAPLAALHRAQSQHEQLMQTHQHLAQRLARCDEAEAQTIPRLTERLRDVEAVVALYATLTDLQQRADANATEAHELDQRVTVFATRQGVSDELARDIAYEAELIAAHAATLATEEATLNEAFAAVEQHGANPAALDRSRADLNEAQQRLTLAEREVAAWERRHAEAQAAEQEAHDHRAAVAALIADEATQTSDLATAQAGYRHATERDALERWLHGADEAQHLSALQAAQTEANRAWVAAQAEAEQRASLAQAAQRGIVLRAGGAVVSLMAAIGLVAFGYLGGLALMVVAGVLGWLTYRATQAQTARSADANHARAVAAAAQQRLAQATADEQAWRTIGGSKLREDAERLLDHGKFAIPEHAEAARQRISALPAAVGTPTEWETRVRAAQDVLTLTRQQRVLAEQQRATAERRRADMGDVDTEGVRLHSSLDEAAAAVAIAAGEVTRHAIALGSSPEAAAVAMAHVEYQNQRDRVAEDRAALPMRRQALAERRTRLAEREREQADHLTWLAEAQAADYAGQGARLAHQRATLASDMAAVQAHITLGCQALHLAPELATLLAEGGAVERDLHTQRAIVAEREDLLAQSAANQQAIAGVNAAAATTWVVLREAVPELALPTAMALEAATLATIDARLQSLQTEWEATDGPHKLSEINQRLGGLTTSIKDAEASHAEQTAQIDQWAQSLGIAATASELPAPSAEAFAAQQQRVTDLQREHAILQNAHDELARSLAIAPDTALDYAQCAQRTAELRHEVAVRKQAVGIAEAVRRRMIQKVLPQTTQNMRQLLP